MTPRNDQLEEIYETERQTNRHTRYTEYFGNSAEISQECLQRSKPNRRLTDLQENWNTLEIVQKYPGNISNKFQKDISSKTGDIPILT